VLGLPEAGTDGHTFVFGQIPEPTSLGLFGFAGLVLARRRR
jgi:hypothetical protein